MFFYTTDSYYTRRRTLHLLVASTLSITCVFYTFLYDDLFIFYNICALKRTNICDFFHIFSFSFYKRTHASFTNLRTRIFLPSRREAAHFFWVRCAHTRARAPPRHGLPLEPRFSVYHFSHIPSWRLFFSTTSTISVPPLFWEKRIFFVFRNFRNT